MGRRLKKLKENQGDLEKSIDCTRQGFEKSFQEAVFYNKQTVDDKHLKLLTELVHPNKGDIILDIGTGNGYVAFALASLKKNCKVIGMDIVAATLERNKQKAQKLNYSNLEFLTYDGKRFPFEDNSLDIIVTRYALHHFPNLLDSFLEMFRVLKKGGRLVISDPTPNKNDLDGFVDRFMQIKQDGHIKFYTFEEYVKMLKDIGFQLDKHQDSVIRFPRKNPKEYENLLVHYEKNILDDYEIEIVNNEIWIKENVLNMVYKKI